MGEGHNASTALMCRASQLKLVGHIGARYPVVIGTRVLRIAPAIKCRGAVVHMTDELYQGLRK